MKKSSESNLSYVVFMGIVMSFIGWLVENLSILITRGYIDSRYYILPFISSYSLIVFIWYFLYKKYPHLIYYDNCEIKKRIIYNILEFLTFSLMAFLLELIYGNLIEYLYGIQLWNYIDIPLHVTKYANIFLALLFGLEGMFLIKWLYPKVFKKLKQSGNKKIIRIFNIILGSLIFIDIVIFNINLLFCKKVVIYWKLRF